MKHKSLSLAVLLLSLFFLFSINCDDNNNIIDSFDIFPLENFPNQIGTAWKYERYDSLTSVIDTLVVTITDSAKITADSLPVTVWTYQTADSTDTMFVYINADTLFYYQKIGDIYYIPHLFIFPLKPDVSWDYNLISCELVGIKQIETKAGTFNNGYHVRQHSNGFNEYLSYDFWFVIDRGLVFKTVREIAWTEFSNDTWNLIEFLQPDSMTISQFPLQVHTGWDYQISIESIVGELLGNTSIHIVDSIYSGNDYANETWSFVEGYLDDYNDRLIQTIQDNEVVINWNGQYVNFRLQFPFKIGDTWENILSSDTIHVVDRRDVTTPSGTYEKAYYLTGRNSTFYEGYRSEFKIWIVPDIGIVKLDYSSYSMNLETRRVWMLNKYYPHDEFIPYTIDQFPNNDGISWTYEVTDNYLDIFDTVTVQVSESALVAVWYYNFGDSSSAELVSVENDKVFFISQDGITFVRNSLEFPVFPGKRWETFPLSKISIVHSISEYETELGTFSPAYKVTSESRCGAECYLIETVWYAPHVGIIYKQVVHSNIFYDGAFVETKWRLIDYNLQR